jgi:hypothetical protein
MDLTIDEKRILTLMDDMRVSDFEDIACKRLKLSKEKVSTIVDKLKKARLVEVMALSDEADLWFFHTAKVTPEMLDKLVLEDIYHEGPAF